jgi:ATP synthase protein I
MKLEGLNKYAKYMSLGIELAGAMVIPLLGGYYGDKYFDTRPVLTLIGAFLGFTGVFWNIYKVTKDLERDQEREQELKKKQTEKRSGDK